MGALSESLGQRTSSGSLPGMDWASGSEVEYNGRVLFRELKEKGYRGKYDTVRKYLVPLRPATGNRQMTVRKTFRILKPNLSNNNDTRYHWFYDQVI